MAEKNLSFKGKRWSLHGMTALVTGGTRGIGHAIVEELAEFGAAVHICSRNEEDINKCLEEWKGKGFRVTGSACDLLSCDQRENLMETVASVFQGKLNILVNNVGTCTLKTITNYTAEDVTTIMGTNFESCYHLCQLAYPLLKASRYGSIVFISSVAGKIGSTEFKGFAKHRVHQMAPIISSKTKHLRYASCFLHHPHLVGNQGFGNGSLLLYQRLLSGTANQEKPTSNNKSKDDSGQGKESGGKVNIDSKNMQIRCIWVLLQITKRWNLYVFFRFPRPNHVGLQNL